MAQRDTGAQIWISIFHAETVIRSFILPKWLGGRDMAFSSSGSIKSDLNERDPKLRTPLMRRLKVILWDCKVWIHLAYIIYVLVAVCWSTIRGFESTTTWKELGVYQLTHAFWPPLLWLVSLAGCWTPIKYAIWPPTMPDREELLDRDEKTGVTRPKEEWKKQRYGACSFWREVQYSGVTIFTAVIFFGSFFVTI